MHINLDLEVAAWSDDGGSALLRRFEGGPEGGDSLVWLVVNAAGVGTFMVSSNFSPGDGSTPETVAESTCRSTAKELATRLAHFDGVTVHPEKCAGNRQDIVEITPLQADRVARSLAPEGTTVKRIGRRIRVAREGQEVVVVKVNHRANEIAWATAGPLILVVERGGEIGDPLLAAVVQTPAGMVTVPVR